jgi:hypothetical protein
MAGRPTGTRRVSYLTNTELAVVYAFVCFVLVVVLFVLSIVYGEGFFGSPAATGGVFQLLFGPVLALRRYAGAPRCENMYVGTAFFSTSAKPRAAFGSTDLMMIGSLRFPQKSKFHVGGD